MRAIFFCRISLAMLLFFGCSCRGNVPEDAGLSADHAPQDGNNGPQDQGPSMATFEPVSPAASLRKVKTLLTGSTPTAAEFTAYRGDSQSLAGLVDGWMKTDAFRATLQQFFTTQFQQGQVQRDDFPASMYDQDGVEPSDTLMVALRNSFGRTMMALLDEGSPFTAAMTTQRFMMTTELMSYYAYTDTSLLGDDLVRSTRWDRGGANFGPTFRQAGGPVSPTDAANPNSANYLTFYWPSLVSSYDNNNARDAQICAAVDPVVMTAVRCPGGSAEWGINVWNLLQGSGNFFGQILYFYPGGGGFKNPDTLCQAYNHSVKRIYSANDANDWRMVQIRPPRTGEAVTEFFDLDRIRSGNVLLMQGDRVGFFTTPAFLSQWGTNASNSSRGAANQTLIAALGHQIEGTDSLPLTSPTAVDANHARDAVCFSCHQTLDPMRQFFRQSYSLSYSQQKDPKQIALPSAFSFRGSVAPGSKVAGFGKALAQHPELAQAWTMKLCAWANSAPCNAADPEIDRIAKLFAASNYDFYAMARALFVSPLVTYAAPTLTAQQGKVASIARRFQLCALLSARLGIADLCDVDHALADGANTIAARAAVLPSDGYSRGVDTPLFVTQPEPFYVGNVENICALAAALAVDGEAKWVASDDADVAIQRIVRDLMGVPDAQASTPAAALREHLDAARTAGASATVATRSAFVAACTSAAVTTVGQ